MPEFRSTSLPANRNWKKSASKSRTLSRQFTRTGILFVISAPSGAGKTTLCDALRQTPDFVYSVSCTTRAPRAGEIEGDDYHFVSEKDFLARVEAGDFLEHANVHGRYYETIRRALCDVFIMPPDLDELRKRLTKRGTETPEQIESRIVTAAREMELWRDYRYTIISKSMEEDLQK